MPESMEKLFQRHGFDVSRETMHKLDIYERLLQKWQKAINLVGPATIEQVAERHFLDSAQLLRHIPEKTIRLADMGSGAGFPGMVLAIFGVKDVHLIESDVRKATFLREVSRETNTEITIHDIRAEDCVIPNIDVFTARALSQLKDLLKLTVHLVTPDHDYIALFMKGAQLDEEIKKAEKAYNFNIEIFPSLTDPSGRVCKVSAVHLDKIK